MAPLFLSNCPRNLTAWSCCGKTRDTMQVFTIANMIKDSSLPPGSFGTGASSRTDGKKQWLFLGSCAGALLFEKLEKWNGIIWEFQAGNNELEKNGVQE